ncbi:MAG: SDR family NAD(P)-dependent oxidoreductase [Gammaproteobacteria bacterium]|nr:SDR family NAD(P)-dependent oxidoreductase [Gammaproteobacteria bacterium]MBP6053343.1 SDR family NAD(P)-dependent oxidoreductase [Pseudomonadales bacterium]MBK7168779.1 SDR family NAD(P)-dependent oxidoreductase [Gammaproteobacteria bacterium]MBK7520156.1 SDR family NAD(P)-dependent oxidoreductase [Gammaproteobacteria bacterium]MBK7729625.1 SDR family NAD(P)-dependent oxidoreductase [Gammaproteobacteria bacterium]
MKDLRDKVAVITGGASGIGFSLAQQALARGMRVVIADIEATVLERAAAQLDGSLLCVRTDVSNPGSVNELARKTLQHFGGVHLLFNNAGVGGGGPLWEASAADWEWVLGVNLWGVINGVRAFTPHLIAQNEGHIVNTASIAGLMSAPGTSTYTVSKHAVVALSEVLHGDLRNAGADVGVSVLCPSFVNTQIYASDRNRHDEQMAAKSAQQLAEQAVIEEMTAAFFSTALAPERVAEQVFEAIAERRFYILTHPQGSKQQVEQRLGDILQGRNPSVSGPEAYPTE